MISYLYSFKMNVLIFEIVIKIINVIVIICVKKRLNVMFSMYDENYKAIENILTKKIKFII